MGISFYEMFIISTFLYFKDNNIRMLIQSIKESSSKNGSPIKQHKNFANMKNTCKSNVFINQSFLSKLAKAEENCLTRNRYSSSSPANKHCSLRNIEDIQLQKKLKLVSLIKSDRKSYNESSIKLSQIEYKAINRNLQYLFQRKRRKARSYGTEGDESCDLNSSIKITNQEMTTEILKITKSLQNNPTNYQGYCVQSARKKRNMSLKLPLYKINENNNTNQNEEKTQKTLNIYNGQEKMKTEHINRKNQNEESDESGESQASEKGKKTLRCHIKLKPTPKMKWMQNKKESMKNPQLCSNQIMNQSVRGWTKYPMKALAEQYDIDQPV